MSQFTSKGKLTTMGFLCMAFAIFLVTPNRCNASSIPLKDKVRNINTTDENPEVLGLENRIQDDGAAHLRTTRSTRRQIADRCHMFCCYVHSCSIIPRHRRFERWWCVQCHRSVCNDSMFRRKSC